MCVVRPHHRARRPSLRAPLASSTRSLQGGGRRRRQSDPPPRLFRTARRLVARRRAPPLRVWRRRGRDGGVAGGVLGLRPRLGPLSDGGGRGGGGGGGGPAAVARGGGGGGAAARVARAAGAVAVEQAILEQKGLQRDGGRRGERLSHCRSAAGVRPRRGSRLRTLCGIKAAGRPTHAPPPAA